MVYWNKTNFSTKNTCNCKKKIGQHTN